MRSYRRLQAAIAALIVAYVVVSTAIKVGPGPSEIFPVFSWSLFSHVPNLRHDYGLLILAVDGRGDDPPRYIEETRGVFPRAHRAVRARNIQELGRAASENDWVRARDIRRFIEPLYLGERRLVRYAIVRRAYDPLERWKRGTFLSEERVSVFETGRDLP